MTKLFSGLIPRFIVLLCLFPLPCRATSLLLLHPEAPELNRRSPDVFEVCLETTKGKISIEVHRDWSPHGADRFYNLVCGGYYNDTRFFRVIKGRWAQFGINGDPEIANTWRAQTIPDDARIESNTRGTVAYAFAAPNGRTTQVFINLKDNSATHDAEFVPFGKVVQGMEVADALDAQYGESAGGGIRAGKQDPLYEKGNAYLQDNFPLLDGIIRATIVDSRREDNLSKADARIQFGGTAVELVISEVSEQTLRIQLSSLVEPEQEQKASAAAALVPFPQTEKLRVRELSRERRLRVGHLRVSVKPQPLAITVCRADGTLVQELFFGEDNQTNSILFRTSAPVLGLGEGADQFDRRGVSYPLINGQRYRLAELGTRIFSPFLIGTEGWALFVNAPAGGFDLRSGRGAVHSQPGATLGTADLFVIDAKEPAEAMREFVHLTGTPVMPPKWALGYMQSHRTLSSEAAILEEARTFREKQLPCDTLIFLGTGFCPAGWNFGHDSFQFNTNVFVREPSAVIQDLHSEHLHVVLHVVPLERDYPSLHGQIPAAPDEMLDQQDIGKYWRRHEALFAAGVDGWWPDEGDWFDATSRVARHRMYYEGPLSDRPNVRPWNLQRNGAPGIARYGGWVWSGDILSSWKTFRAQVKVGLNSCLSVSPFWGTDIGGFYPSTNLEYTGELYARWFQFATFCPSFRSHGRNWWLHRPWGWNTGEAGPIESRPPPDPSELHNPDVEPVCRKFLNLRYQLMPYTYTITREAHDTGLPLMRALWLHYPDDPEAVKLGDEFLWGRDLLIAPVTEKGAKSRRVYLPPGDWFDWWTGERMEGRRWIDRPIDLATLPIYVRAGAIIPVDPVRQYISQTVSEPTTLRICPGASGQFTLYDDDGESLGYRNGSDPKTIWIRFRWDGKARRLVIDADPRMKQWPGGNRSFSVQVVGDAHSKRIDFHGQRETVTF